VDQWGEGVDGESGRAGQLAEVRRQLSRLVERRFCGPLFPAEQEWYSELLRREIELLRPTDLDHRPA
jgi:hypothetical protein